MLRERVPSAALQCTSIFDIVYCQLITTYLQYVNMEEKVKIDSQTFHSRLSTLTQAWKADRRSGDALFGGAGSLVVLMGKNEESATPHKNNAIHVSVPYSNTHLAFESLEN